MLPALDEIPRYDEDDVLLLQGYEVKEDVPFDFHARRREKTTISYWVQWYFDDIRYWTDHITHSRERAYEMFFDHTLLFPLPIVKVALIRCNSSSREIDIIDARYN